METTLLRVYKDLLLAVDQGNEAVLILLDYFAAFDTISHNVFLIVYVIGMVFRALS